MSEKDNIVKFKKPFKFNIAYIIFAVLFIYLCVMLVNVITQKKVSTYQVTTGDLSSFYSLQALAIRQEEVVTASSDGYITYFAKEDTKVGAKSLVFALDSTGNLKDSIKSEAKEEDFFSSEQKDDLMDCMDDYSFSYTDDSFYNVYAFKDDVNVKIASSAAEIASDSKFLKGMAAYYAYEPGVVLYTIDGLEDLTVDSFTDANVSAQNYSLKNLKSNTSVKAGDEVYKLITDENWYLVAKIDDKVAKALENESYVQLRILQDNYVKDVPFTITQKEGNYYIIYELSTGVIRYANSRYLNVEMVLDCNSGYKIPNSSIKKEAFYKIPKSFVTKGGNGNASGFLTDVTTEDNKSTVSFEKCVIYSSDDDFVYIHDSNLQEGSTIYHPTTNESYVLKDTEEFPIVYCVNKGYAVLRVVNIITSNEDYSIVAKDTKYGLTIYDYIVLDVNEVEENELIN